MRKLKCCLIIELGRYGTEERFNHGAKGRLMLKLAGASVLDALGLLSR